MAQFTFDFYSEVLRLQMPVTMILPVFSTQKTNQESPKLKTLWLLHGGGGNNTDYIRNTLIEKCAMEHNLAVVMPSVGNSFYHDINESQRFYTYMTEELPEVMRRYFPLSAEREDNFIAGLSMGGFGAAKIAFTHPERFAAVGLMSTGPMGLHQLLEAMNVKQDIVVQSVFGDLAKIPGSENDIWYLLEQAVKEKKVLPRIYNCCGTEDFTYGFFKKFREFAKDFPLDITYAEGPGEHNWDFWAEYLLKIVDWML